MDYRKVGLVALILFPPVMLVATIRYFHAQYLLVGVLLLCMTFLVFFQQFEKRRVDSREIVLLATLAAIAAVSRVPFSFLPSIQPTSFVIIVSAIVFGAESGFLIGAIAAFVSNMMLGQGPWTPWQMYSWGLIGLCAGLLRNYSLMKNRWGLLIYGLLSGIGFGWLMNIWFLIGVIQEITIPSLISYFATSFAFDIAHGLSNVLFLLLFANGWIKILTRFKKKYCLMN